MVDKTFYGNIQSRGQGGRIVIELPKDLRKDYRVGEHVKVIIKKLRK